MTLIGGNGVTGDDWGGDSGHGDDSGGGVGCEGFSIMIYCGNKENLLGAAFKKYNPSYAQLKAAPVLEGPTSFEKDAIDHDGSNNDNKNNVNNIDNDNDNNNNIENNNNNKNNINNKKNKTKTTTTT